MARDELCDLLAPVLATVGLDLYDVEVGPGLVRVTVDRPGHVDLDDLAKANGVVSAALDQADPLPGRYTLEVSSPGVERRLRSPKHYRGAVGETVSVRTHPGRDLPRRVTGLLAAADDQGFDLEGPEVPEGRLRVAYDSVERARTVFAWGSRPPAGSPGRRPRSAARRPGGSGRGRTAATAKVETERVTTS